MLPLTCKINLVSLSNKKVNLPSHDYRLNSWLAMFCDTNKTRSVDKKCWPKTLAKSSSTSQGVWRFRLLPQNCLRPVWAHVVATIRHWFGLYRHTLKLHTCWAASASAVFQNGQKSATFVTPSWCRTGGKGNGPGEVKRYKPKQKACHFCWGFKAEDPCPRSRLARVNYSCSR